MKTIKARLSSIIFILTLLGITYPGTLRAEVLDRNDIMTRKGPDNEAKAYVLDAKAKIAEERQGIIAADKRLREAKKTKDKALIAQVKQEVDQDIKARKAKIRSLYVDINNKIGQSDNFMQDIRDRARR